ncbi:MAG: glycosyl hydrolase, partial [Bacteroidota bacterium]
WDTLRQELKETAPKALLLVKDENGNPVRWIEGAKTKGLHRTNWDLRLPAPNPIRLTRPSFQPPWAGEATGPLAAPGQYSVELYLLNNGELTMQGEAQTFQVKAVPTVAEDTDFQAVTQFQEQTAALMRQTSSAGAKLSEVQGRLRHLEAAITKTPKASSKHFATLQQLREQVLDLQMRLYGDPIRQQFSESTVPSIAERVGGIAYGHWSTRQMPTQTFKDDLAIATKEFAKFKVDLKVYLEALEAFEGSLEKAGAPFTRGRGF